MKGFLVALYYEDQIMSKKRINKSKTRKKDETLEDYLKRILFENN